MCAWTVSWALEVNMWKGTMLAPVRGLTCTSKGQERLRFFVLIVVTAQLTTTSITRLFYTRWIDLGTFVTFSRRKMTIILDLDTRLRRSPPDWLSVNTLNDMNRLFTHIATFWIWCVFFFPISVFIHLGIEGGFDVEPDHYEEDIKVVILPDRQEITSEELPSMPDVVRERVSASLLCFFKVPP